MCQNRSKTEFGHQMGLEVPNFDDLDAIRYSFSQGIRSWHSRARFRPFWDRKRPNHEKRLKPNMEAEIAAKSLQKPEVEKKTPH